MSHDTQTQLDKYTSNGARTHIDAGEHRLSVAHATLDRVCVCVRLAVIKM